ncbi:MAG TPA: glycosyltransferase family 1 protein [Candidatus Saccharimonadales bacterium]
MKRIVIDGRIINSSTGRYVERLVEHLQDVDTENEYIVLVPTKDNDYWRPRAKNFRVQTADFKNYSLEEQVGFAKFLYNLDADLVHFCMPQQPLLYLRPHVTTIHDLTLLNTYNSDKNWLVYHLKQLVGRAVFFVIGHSSRHIIAISNFTNRAYRNFAKIPATKITTIYEASDIPAGKKTPMQLPYKEFILYVGQQSDYKNIKRLMQAHQQLLATHPDLGLVLVGSKNEAAQRNEAWAKARNFKNITFTGFVSNEELAWLYSECGTYAFPSLMEGFGLPSLEAMAFGAPVTSSNATCLPEINGDAAHYFDPTDVDDMANKIGQVLTNSTLRARLVAAGKKQIKKYSWHTCAKQTHQVYLAALKK